MQEVVSFFSHMLWRTSWHYSVSLGVCVLSVVTNTAESWKAIGKTDSALFSSVWTFILIIFQSLLFNCCLSNLYVSVKPNQVFCLDVFQINDDFLPALNQKSKQFNTFSCLFYGRSICCLKLTGLLIKLLSKMCHVLVKIIFKNNQIVLFLSRNIKEDILNFNNKYWIYSEAKCSKREK